MTYYGFDEEKKDLSAKEIVDRFGIGYYELLIEDLEERISNIRLGNGDSIDGHTYMSEERLKSSKEKQKRIDELKKRIATYKETIREINEAIHAINKSMIVLEQAEERHALISSLTTSLKNCFLKYEVRDDKRIAIPSDTYNTIFVNKMFKNIKSPYRRFTSKEYGKVEKETRKIKQEIYKKLKKLQNKRVVEINDQYNYSSDKYDYVTLNDALKDNRHYLTGFTSDLSYDIRRKYDAFDVDTLAPLGVEVDKLKYAYALSDSKEGYSDLGHIVESMSYLSENYNVQNRFKTFYILKEKLEEVDKLSREVECLDLIIDAYDNTAIRNTDLFKELIEIHRKQSKKKRDLSLKATEMYDKSGMREYIEIEEKLRELYRNSCSFKHQMSDKGENSSYYDYDTSRAKDLYYGARAEMLSILLKYPELNRSEYGIDLRKYDKKGRYIGEEPELNENTYNNPAKAESEEQIIPTVVVTEEELRRDLGYEQTPQEEVTILEVPNHLSTIRTAYYSRYMVEKVKGSQLGKMYFSEYLEQVAPNQEELITIEKNREQKAANIFKLYVYYLASQKDKSQAMKFSEFARLRYGLNIEELPFEYSDEEVQKRLK